MSEYAFNPLTGNLDRIGDGGGGGGSITITTDQGTPITGDTFSIEGQEYKDIAVMEVTNDGSDISIANNSWVTAYVVDPSTADGVKGTFTTIQAALDAAFANSDTNNFVTIEIRQSYSGSSESLTFPAGKYHIKAQTPISSISVLYDAGLVLILNATIPATAQVVFENIVLTNSSSPIYSNAGQITFIKCFVEGTGNNTESGYTKAFNCQLSFINITGGVFFVQGCILNANVGILNNTVVYCDSCIQLYDGTSLALNGTTNGTFFNCSNLNLTGDTVGTISFNNCSLLNTADLPSATIRFNEISASTDSNLTEFFTTPFNLLQKKPASQGNVMKRRPSNIAVDTVGWSDQYIAFIFDSPQVITFDSGLVATEQVFYFFDESGNASTYSKTISAGAGKTINGQTEIVINEDYGWAIVTYDGTNYFAFTR